MVVLNGFKIRLLFGGVIAAAVACAAPWGHAAQPAGSRNVAAWVATATKVGTAQDEKTVTIAVHMAVTNSAALKKLVEDVSSPSSRQYGQYLTPDEFGNRFAPAASDVAAVEKLLGDAGMSEIQTGPHGVYVSATASVGQLRATFRVSQDLYSYRGMTLRANREEPTLPAALIGKILYVEGLDDSTALRHPFHHSATMGDLAAPAAPASTPYVTAPPVATENPPPYCNTNFGPSQLVANLSTAAGVYGAAIPWLNCGYTPQQIQAAYGLNAVKPYDGTGITVAIVDAYASPTLQADGNRYATNHKLPALTLGKNFALDIPPGIYSVSPSAPCGPYGWWLEQSLDVAAVHGSAPGANILYVGSKDCFSSLTLATFNAIYNHMADVVTNSWGNNGEAIAPGEQSMFDQALMAAAAQGTTVLFSSGDNGDLSALNGFASGAWPATSSYVTGVGGTSLKILNAAGAKLEYGWGTYRDFLNNATVVSASQITTSGLATTSVNGSTYDAFAFYSGAGGGISLLESQPSYQAPLVPAKLATTLHQGDGFSEPLPAAQRVSPDVAMVADPYTGYLFGETFTIAGNAISDFGCTPISKTQEYCEGGEGGTSLASPLMAGVIAIMDQQRKATGAPVVGFANPLLYSLGSGGNGVNLTTAPLNQIVAPGRPISVIRGYANNLTEVRVVTISSVPTLAVATPYPLTVCSLPVCLGINDVFNYTSQSAAGNTKAGYNDVTGLGVPYLPKLLQ